MDIKYFSFYPFGNSSLYLKFKCDNCGTNVVSDNIWISEPDYSAETSSDSQTESEGHAMCEKCYKEFEINLYTTYAGGDGNINLPNEYEVTVIENPEPYYEEQYDAIADNSEFFDTFKQDIQRLKELNELKLNNPLVANTLYRQIYIGIITTMETYLSDAFINTVLSSENYIKSFVENFHEYKTKTIPLNKLYQHIEKMPNECKKNMLDIIYHNLPKVKGLYKDILDVDLGAIGDAHKAVSNRHDLVHRNGKTKKGNCIIISKEDNEILISYMETFIKNIDLQIKPLYNFNPFQGIPDFF